MKKTRRAAVIIGVPAKAAKSALKRIVENPKRIRDEDEADYQYSMAAIRQGGKQVSAESVLKKYGRRVEG